MNGIRDEERRGPESGHVPRTRRQPRLRVRRKRDERHFVEINIGDEPMHRAIASVELLLLHAEAEGHGINRAALHQRKGIAALLRVHRMDLGAQAALIGRPVLWGLAANGEEGAYRVLELLKAEFDLAMALCGARTVGEIDKSLVS